MHWRTWNLALLAWALSPFVLGIYILIELAIDSLKTKLKGDRKGNDEI